jgi:N-acetylglucosamine-6-sulfatase
VPCHTEHTGRVVLPQTDDQDLQLGSMRAMPNTVSLIGRAGANMTNHFVNTPICCPSRATIISGNFAHTNRVVRGNTGGCMHMNTSMQDNPNFWPDTFVPALHNLGYTTGMFGKLLNTMTTYGCAGDEKVPEGESNFRKLKHRERSQKKINVLLIAQNRVG